MRELRVLPALAPALAARGLCVFSLLFAACSNEVEAPKPQKKGPPPPPQSAATLEVGAGTFAMGRPLTKQAPYGSDWFVNETPEHMVTLSAFAIDRSEVTVAEYVAYLEARGGLLHFSPLMPIDTDGAKFTTRAGAERRPMTYVTWADARAYCAWRPGGRLPTEAEWERVAKGNGATPRAYPWGPEPPSCARAVFFTGTSACAAEPANVAERAPGDTPDGVHDLAGNVAEWVADFYDAYAPDPATDPKGPDTGAYRVVRGGGYRDVPLSLRTTARWPGHPETRSPGVGFRCAASR